MVTRTILIIEDNSSTRKVLRIALESQNYQVIEAKNGKTAIASIKTHKPDLILQDMALPDISGAELTQKLRALLNNTNIPILMLSGFLRETEEIDRNNQGETAYLLKPVEPSHVLEIIKGYLCLPPVRSDPPGHFDEKHLLSKIHQLEQQILHNAGLAKRCAMQLTQLTLLSSVTRAMKKHVSYENLLKNILSASMDAVGVSKGMIYLFDKKKSLQLGPSIGYRDKKKLIDFFGYINILQEIFSQKVITHIPSAKIPELIGQQLLKKAGVNSMLLIPLLSKNRCVGILCFGAIDSKVVVDDPGYFMRTLGMYIGQAIASVITSKNLVASEMRVAARTSELALINVQLKKEIIERQAIEEQTTILNTKLVTAAKRAGMVEIATEVVHNIGNVLNSVNVATGMLKKKIEQSKMLEFRNNINRLLKEHGHDFAAFITYNPHGKNFVAFLKILADSLENESSQLMQEVDDIARNIDHIVSIVLAQKAITSNRVLFEQIIIADIIEDALSLILKPGDYEKIDVIRKFETLNTVTMNKSNLLQIITNLIKNSLDAVSLKEVTDKKITLSFNTKDSLNFMIQVMDTGIGISAEHMTKIFSYGFTTKKQGHGFGLHSSANLAKEMGGHLSVTSDGIGKGAVFTLILPYEPPYTVGNNGYFE